MAADRVQIPFTCSEELAAAFDEAHTRMGYTPLSERIERLLLLEIEPLTVPHVRRRHGDFDVTREELYKRVRLEP